MSAILHYGTGRPVGFAHKLATSLDLLRQLQQDYPPEQIIQACSLGVEDMVLLHLRAVVAAQWSVFVLDTGKLHTQTLDLLRLAQQHFGLQFEVFRPDPAQVLALTAEHGDALMFQSLALRQACCDVRKTQPLKLALNAKRAWITGLRQEQSPARAAVALRAADPTAARGSHTREKINPLAHWTRVEMWQYVACEHIPYNPLHDQFYPSIGCAPCTRAISLGEDERAGRWWWESSNKECGLHAQS